MNNKFSLAISFLIFNFSLSAFAEEIVPEIVITGTQNTSNTTSTPQQTTIQIPESSGNNQYSSVGYAQAMAEKAAAEEKGRRIEACYKQLASLDSSKFACSEDGELIDVVEVTGVKAGDNSAPSLVNEALYNELDNTRPVAPVIPKPESCNANAIAVKLQECRKAANVNFGDANDKCIVAGGIVMATSVAGGVFISLRMRDPNVIYTRNQMITIGGAGGVVGAYIGEILGNMVRDGCTGHYSAARDVDLAQCDLDEKTKIQECANYN